jgi:tRNA threonylcarbamoyladenosine biosynthesis protein TsaB
MTSILCIETSTDVCSVALTAGGAVVAAAEIREAQAHASRLAPLIQEVMAAAGIGSGDLSAVAVSKGPGSYTGLRIGTSTAKGLCYALNIPLIGIGTLDLLAWQGITSTDVDRETLLCPMIDARRMEVYCQVTDFSRKVVMPPSPVVVDESSFLELLNERRVLFLGNGAAKCREVIRHSNANFLDDVVPLASAMAPLAAEEFSAGRTENLVQFTPFYLKEFVAGRAGQSR